MTGLGLAEPTTETDEDPPSETDDAMLVARAKTDRQAFAPLYRRYVNPIYQYCYRRLDTREAAEDATSAIFTQALAALPTCRADAFRSWLFAIAHNVVTDRYRAAKPDRPLTDAVDRPDADPTPEQAALANEDALAIRRLLTQLTPEQRRVLELRLAGLTGAEIARALGRSHPSVRMMQSRALARLRSILGQQPRYHPLETDDANR